MRGLPCGLSGTAPRFLSWGQFLVMAAPPAAVAGVGVLIIMRALDPPMSGMPVWRMVFLYALGPVMVAVSALGTRVFWNY